MNETWPAFARDGNLESVDVFVSWRDEGEELGSSMRPNISSGFGRTSGQASLRGPPLHRAKRYRVRSGCWALARIRGRDLPGARKAARWSAEAGSSAGRTPRTSGYRPRSVGGRGRRGILKHATGSGKTFTARCASVSLGRSEVPLVLVPSELLLGQWEEELRGAFEAVGLQLMICGGGHDRWRMARGLRVGPGRGRWRSSGDLGDPPDGV